MIENKKYIVWPGYVVSKTDGQRHYVAASNLMMLYGVAPHDCVIAPLHGDTSNQAERRRAVLRNIAGMTHLHPHQNGNYTLKNK